MTIPILSWLGAKPAPAPRKPVEIGWLLDAKYGEFLWDAPRRLSRDDPPPRHAKSVNYCPGVLDSEARLFEVPCPFDLRLGFAYRPDGTPTLVNLDGDNAAVRPRELSQITAIVNRKEWRHPDRPVIQIMTPYVFLADEPVHMTQLPPFDHYFPEPWPGLLIHGRLPIHTWPRQLMFALEWWDIKKPLVLKRGEPWFYARFEAYDPTRPFRVFEAEMTPELREYIQGLSAVSNYVNRTWSLFKVAERRRPKTLLVRKQRPKRTPQAEPADPLE
jgi:hypothetical protein